MAALNEKEKQKIIEEERIRADERAKYNQPQRTVKQKRLFSRPIFIIILVFIGLIVSLFLWAEKERRQALNELKEEKQFQQPVISSQLPVVKAATFDVPALLGKSLTQVKTTLGQPDVAPTPPAKYDGKDWEITWEKDGNDLMVSYDVKTLKVIDFFISTDDPSGKTKDTDRLLKIGNLMANDPRYQVKFVPVLKSYNDPGSYTGVTVTPK